MSFGTLVHRRSGLLAAGLTLAVGGAGIAATEVTEGTAVVVEDGDRLVYALILAEADPAVLEQAPAAVDSIRFA